MVPVRVHAHPTMRQRGFRLLGLAAILSGLITVSGCTQSSGDQVEALTSVVEENRQRQEALAARQQELLDTQKKLIEDGRAKQLALIEESRARMVSANALSGKTSDISKTIQSRSNQSTPTQEKPEVKKASAGSTGRVAGNITLNAPWKCVPDRLKAVINEVSRRYGPVTVNSTHRSSRNNRRVGGARNSYHLRCQAVDFRVHGDTRAALRFLQSHPHVGGLKRYRSGFIHIDTGPKRTWR